MTLHSPIFHPVFKRALLGSLLVVSPLTIAEEPSEFTEEDIFIDIPIVVSATRQPQKLTEIPVAISIIDQTLIKASGAQNIAELFKLVPGMQSYNVIANVSAVTYHGVSDDHPRRMEVMLNGHSVYLPLLSTVAWETLGIDLNDIDHIEVIRGSNVPAYGSNAFLGAINIVTKSPIANSETVLSTTQGALDKQRYYAAYQSNAGNLEYRLSANYENNDGYHFYDDGMINRAVNLAGTLTPSLSDTVNFNLGIAEGYIMIGQADDLDSTFSRREHASNYQHIRWDHIIGDDNEVKLSFTHNYTDLSVPVLPVEGVLAVELGASKSDVLAILNNAALSIGLTGIDFTPLANTSQYGGTEHGTTELFDLELQQTLQLSPMVTTVWGVGYRTESAESEVLLSGLGKVTEDKWRLFGNIQWQPTQKLTVNAGGMFEETSMSNLRFSPRLAANYALSNSLAIRTAATKAYRTPSLLEKNNQAFIYNNSNTPWDIIALSDPHLTPEQLTSYELGLFKIWPDSSSTLDIRIFREEISDGIDDFYRAGSDSFNNSYRTESNVAEWDNTGAELQLTYRPSNNTQLLFNYGYNNVKGFRDRGTRGIDSLEAAGNPPEARSPLHTASLLLTTQQNDYSASVAQYFMSSTNWLEGSYRPTVQRTDLVLSKAFPLSVDSRLEARLIVQNLFDKSYEDFYEYNIFDRRAFIQLKLSY